MGTKNADGTPNGNGIRNYGAIPYASQIPNNSNVDGAFLSDALNSLGALGALSYRGAWNAATNTPALASGAGTKGYYYIVSADGATNLDGITDWKIGDLAVYNGTAWQKIDNTDAVASVFGRTGAVVAAASDYDASQVDNDSDVAGTFVSDALNTLGVTKRVKVEDLSIETLNDEQSVAIGGLATDEFCPFLAIVHMKDVGAGAAANGDVQISIGITSGGTEILAATACTGLVGLNTKMIFDLSAVVKPAIPADSSIYVKVTTADTTAGAGHLADVYITGQSFASGV